MLKKIIIVILSLYLVYILGQSFFKLFDWDVEIANSDKIWVKVVSVKAFSRKSHVKGIDLGTTTTWLATVNIKDQKPQVYFSVGRAPRVGECILVTANETTAGNIIATLDGQEWQYGTSYGSCE